MGSTGIIIAFIAIIVIANTLGNVPTVRTDGRHAIVVSAVRTDDLSDLPVFVMR